MLRCFILLLYSHLSLGYGYDAGGDQAACGRPYRAGRMHRPPCDLAQDSYCTAAGTTYPWHAVRRFVRDNQGLMRRMYGDQRHGHVLRDELQQDTDTDSPLHEWQPRSARFRQFTNDVENDLGEGFEYGAQARYLRDDVSNDDVLNTKFVYSEEPTMSIKLAGLKTAPHFRQTTTERPSTLQTSSSSTSTTKRTTTEDSSTFGSLETESSTDATTEQTTVNNVADDRVGEELYSTTTNQEDVEGTTNDDKPSAILFQDMEEQPVKKKPHINYNKLKGVNACPVKEEVVAPFWANNTRGEVLALLNMYPFEQYVHWEKCTFEHRQMFCREGCRCEQQYRLHRLLAYDPNNECRGIFSDWFRFPSCCVCKCYDMPPEFRVTSRSPRFQQSFFDP